MAHLPTPITGRNASREVLLAEAPLLHLLNMAHPAPCAHTLTLTAGMCQQSQTVTTRHLKTDEIHCSE